MSGLCLHIIANRSSPNSFFYDFTRQQVGVIKSLITMLDPVYHRCVQSYTTTYSFNTVSTDCCCLRQIHNLYEEALFNPNSLSPQGLSDFHESASQMSTTESTKYSSEISSSSHATRLSTKARKLSAKEYKALPSQQRLVLTMARKYFTATLFLGVNPFPTNQTGHNLEWEALSRRSLTYSCERHKFYPCELFANVIV